MARYQINISNWLEYDNIARAKMAEVLGLKRTGSSKVYGTKLLSDGHSNEDLAGVTTEKINAIMGTSFAQEDILKAFHGFAEYIINLNQNKKENGLTNTRKQEQGTDNAGNEGLATVKRGNDETGKDNEESDGSISTGNNKRNVKTT